jgi:bacteriocin biosynthesis cyclodehydratase domain-containing protein
MRPVLALPFTVIADPDRVHLIAGEDLRYTLAAPGLQAWLPALLARCDGRQSMEELVAGVPAAAQDSARRVLGRLIGERVLVDGPVEHAHRPGKYRLAVEGDGLLAEALAQAPGAEGALPLPLLCQDRLDYDTALRFNRRCRNGSSPWLWVSTGPLNRGYVSPVFLPGAGPCLACLLRHFQRLSPAPQLYDALIEHARRDGPILPVPFDEQAGRMLVQIALWKVRQAEQALSPSGVYRLHVLECAGLEVTLHPVWRDEDCPECGPGPGQ